MGGALAGRVVMGEKEMKGKNSSEERPPPYSAEKFPAVVQSAITVLQYPGM